MEIISKDNPRVKELSKLNIHKYREEEKMFLVEGKHLVTEAKNAGVLIEAFSTTKKEGYTLLSIPVMNKICNTSTTVSEIGLCKYIEKKELKDKILILDRIQDPGNLGSLLRSAYAFGFETVILGNGSCDIYNDKVIRSSQGAIFKLNFINANLIEFIPTLKDYIVYGTNVRKGISVNDCIKNKKIALVLGNEGSGISEDIDNLIKDNIYIPLNNTESLNVCVAGSILMYELSK